jgi:hypothetical protein
MAMAQPATRGRVAHHGPGRAVSGLKEKRIAILPEIRLADKDTRRKSPSPPLNRPSLLTSAEARRRPNPHSKRAGTA